MKYIPYIVIIVLVGMIIFNGREVEVKEVHTTDTVFVTKIDTVFHDSIVEKEVRVVDTMYVNTEQGMISLPKESKHYSKNGVYDAWVSGYNPSLDSMKVYQRTEFRTITNNNVVYVPDDKWKLYAEAGFSLICGRFSPSVGVSMLLPKRFKIGANLGTHNKEAYYGINVGYRLNK